MPYLEAILANSEFECAIKFRPYRDGFEKWLLENRPDTFAIKNLKIMRGAVQDAVAGSDVVVGTHSTAALEGLLQLKTPIFFYTKKWGDYFGLGDHPGNHPFFASNPQELVEKIRNVRLVSEVELKMLQTNYFGDPYKNGSKWAVEQLKNSIS